MPRDLVERGESRGRGAEGERDVRAGSLSLLLEGLGKMRGQGALHCAPGRTIHTAPRAAVPKYSSLCIRSLGAMHTPSECGGFAPTGFELWRLTPTRAHSVILF